MAGQLEPLHQKLIHSLDQGKGPQYWVVEGHL